MAYLWGWFVELECGRKYGRWGPDPISYTEIAAWALLTDRHPLPHEVEALVTLDVVTRGVLAEQARRDG